MRTIALQTNVKNAACVGWTKRSGLSGDNKRSEEGGEAENGSFHFWGPKSFSRLIWNPSASTARPFAQLLWQENKLMESQHGGGASHHHDDDDSEQLEQEDSVSFHSFDLSGLHHDEDEITFGRAFPYLPFQAPWIKGSAKQVQRYYGDWWSR